MGTIPSFPNTPAGTSRVFSGPDLTLDELSAQYRLVNERLDTITKKMDVHLSDVASSLKALKKGQADIATSHRMLLSEFEKSHDSVADAIGRIESYLDTIPADEYTGTMTYQQFKETDEDDEDNDPQQGGDNDQPADQLKDNTGEPPETENNGGEGTTNHLTPTQSQRGSAHNSRAPSPAARNSRAGSPATGATGTQPGNSTKSANSGINSRTGASSPSLADRSTRWFSEMADKGSDFNWLRNQWVNELPKELKAAIAAGDNAWQQDVQMRQYTVRGRSGHRFSEFMHGANHASPEPTGLRPALPITPLMRQPTPKLPRDDTPILGRGSRTA
ncbi:hypothetical protein SISNIDRAFT_484866 [Sistotremastrum niveocremeum HHB9708]|uniref:Uncharacterized protein n=1 Tax=Sistotremastrum niveocremeum HHB9708 TaxID=1314777 RepID=A0A164V7Q8_9AGAM|nr:hypothetical protein SISNIDRAFT_484866 [Sistotremastrum niveocremeum HHB9708]